jgi:hypothetical protein
MSFKLTCPKCGGTSCNIERDTRTYGRSGDVSELVFSCRCGKQLFGAAVQVEVDRQRSLWDAEQAARADEERQKEEQRRQDERRQEEIRIALARHAAVARKQREDAERQRREDEHRRWAARVAASRSDGHEAGGGVDGDRDPSLCTYPGCNNAKREGSMYCSRDCSNKNARARHAARKKDAA